MTLQHVVLFSYPEDLSPEDAAEMADLRAFTREIMADAERDLGTKLDWVAVDHWNTDNPHIHVLVRGRADDGADEGAHRRADPTFPVHEVQGELAARTPLFRAMSPPRRLTLKPLVPTF